HRVARASVGRAAAQARRSSPSGAPAAIRSMSSLPATAEAPPSNSKSCSAVGENGPREDMIHPRQTPANEDHPSGQASRRVPSSGSLGRKGSKGKGRQQSLVGGASAATAGASAQSVDTVVSGVRNTPPAPAPAVDTREGASSSSSGSGSSSSKVSGSSAETDCKAKAEAAEAARCTAVRKSGRKRKIARVLRTAQEEEEEASLSSGFSLPRANPGRGRGRGRPVHPQQSRSNRKGADRAADADATAGDTRPSRPASAVPRQSGGGDGDATTAVGGAARPRGTKGGARSSSRDP
ncbi:unnamed protein product, partial [Scytosiphon promiscuus]